MKTRVLLVTLAVLLLCWAGTASAITALGQNPFYQPPLTSVDQMKTMFAEKGDDLRMGLEKAGMPELYEPLMTQLPNAEVTAAQYPKGTELDWMFYRRGGKGPVLVDKGVLWESDTPFDGYEFFIDYKDKRYTFVVPLACGNLALADIGGVPVAPVVAPPPEPKPEPEPEPEPKPEPESVVPPAALPLAMIADVGYLYQADPANYLMFRGGVEYPINDNLSVLGLIGVAPKVEGIDGKTAFLIDAFLNYNWSKAFVGVGLGGWLTGGDSDLDTEDNDLDILLDVGYQLYEKPEKYKISAFIEARSAVDELGDFDMYGRLGGGLRFSF